MQEPVAAGSVIVAQCARQRLKDLAPEIASRVEVNPIEILRSGPSFTIDTVFAVAQTYPGDQIALIFGTDAFTKIALASQ
jgi:nicotinate-nucleotide adenylyltransferase